MSTDTLDTKYGSFWYVVLEHYLQGHTSPYTISKALGLPDIPPLIRRMVDDPEFGRQAYEARREPEAIAVKRIKSKLLTYVGKMDSLALDDSDKRTQFAALKDLMDRGDTGARHKIDIRSPAAYREAVAEYAEDEPTPAKEEEVESASPGGTE